MVSKNAVLPRVHRPHTLKLGLLNGNIVGGSGAVLRGSDSE